MSHYYRQNCLLWSNDGFDLAWAGRENWLICDDSVMGFISLSHYGKALYIRELHLLACCRKQGAGSWVLEQMALKANMKAVLVHPRPTICLASPKEVWISCTC